MPDRNALASMMIASILTQWPHTAQVFHQHRMACVGCALAPYYSLAEAASIYRLSVDELLDDILSLIASEIPPNIALLSP